MGKKQHKQYSQLFFNIFAKNFTHLFNQIAGCNIHSDISFLDYFLLVVHSWIPQIPDLKLTFSAEDMAELSPCG